MNIKNNYILNKEKHQLILTIALSRYNCMFLSDSLYSDVNIRGSEPYQMKSHHSTLHVTHLKYIFLSVKMLFFNLT